MTDKRQQATERTSQMTYALQADGPAHPSRTEFKPVDPDQLAADRAARRGLHPPQPTLRRLV